MHKPLLWEIGTEEIPARFLPDLIQQITRLAGAGFQERGLSYGSLRVLATPRRLTLLVQDLAEKAEDVETEAKGPSVQAAYDENGQPTKALLGFCRGQGLDLDQLYQKELNNNLYVFGRKKTLGRRAMEILPELLPALADKLFFPKPMRWGDNPARFVRPIHWIVALYGTDVIPFSYAGVTSGRVSRGHRILGSDAIQIPEPDAYLDLLEQNYVLVDQEERRTRILHQIQAVAESLHGQADLDEDLLTEVVYLVEYPTALWGAFDQRYLELPPELVITPMRDQQRYFPVLDNQGRLLPYFITVRNGDDYGLDQVAAGNQRVLAARLADAAFFYQEDLRQVLDQNVEKLAAVVFHEKLGSLRQKVGRVAALAEYIGEQLGYSQQELAQTRRAAYLAKADLASHVVYEFPELQGIIGEYYAKAAGEDPLVATAIREHYLPRFAGDDLPQTKPGIAVALADKIDTLLAFFAIGQIPSGSQDPFALRRAATGCTQIIIQQQLDLSLRAALDYAYRLLENDIPALDRSVVRERIESAVAFLHQRLENFLNERGISYDVIQSVQPTGLQQSNMLAALGRAKALQDFRSKLGFRQLLSGFHRSANILRNAREKGKKLDLPPVDPALFTDSAEQRLYTAVQAAEERVAPLLEQGGYGEALEALSQLAEPIDAFFEAVMVMDPDERVRTNRMALLQRIVILADSVADLRKIVE